MSSPAAGQASFTYAPDYLPKDVQLIAPSLLAGTMRKAEAEFAAALVVLSCQLRGNAWQPTSTDHIAAALSVELERETEIGRLVRNPFFRPNAGELVARGFARRVDDDTVELTEAAFEAMRPWVKRGAK
jgi:hypothetical protein